MFTEEDGLMDREIYLRRAEMSDAEDILRWRNDEETRANSFNREEISLLSHMNWMKKKLSQEDTYMFILMDGDTKVGNIRVDVMDDIGEISYCVAPECRGRGYGTEMITLVEKEMPPKVSALTGLTLKSNKASGRCFIKNGYTASDAGDALCYSKGLAR